MLSFLLSYSLLIEKQDIGLRRVGNPVGAYALSFPIVRQGTLPAGRVNGNFRGFAKGRKFAEETPALRGKQPGEQSVQYGSIYERLGDGDFFVGAEDFAHGVADFAEGGVGLHGFVNMRH
jgi:hypothetical protein